VNEFMSAHGQNVQPGNADRAYVLMTAAHNEEVFIEQTIRSVLSQTQLPRRWMIVSDGSTDRTDEIVENYARQNDFIRFLRLVRPPGRNFGSKVAALQKGSKLLTDADFAFIGNIDADVCVEPTYFADLIDHFARYPMLGLASGFVCEEKAGEFRSRRSNRVHSVPHAAQLVRRECYETIGGYAVLPHGGEDWYAQTCAKMNGWEIEAIPELSVFHHRHTGAAGGLLRAQFRLGRLDYSLGSDPSFEIFKCLGRFGEGPLFVGSLVRLAGFCWSYGCRGKRPVSSEFVAFLRSEQRSKVRALFHKSGGPTISKHKNALERAAKQITPLS
jgi:biofilm PGA synthesis N-glycosyltransferase PgaC